MVWTQFWDMHSGGGSKEKWGYIYIEAPEKEAKIIFYNRFGHNPERVTCTCCGEDYAIHEYKTLRLATAHQRACATDEHGEYVERASRPDDKYSSHGEYIPLAKFIFMKEYKFIYKKQIKDSERIGEVPEEGYVWR